MRDVGTASAASLGRATSQSRATLAAGNGQQQPEPLSPDDNCEKLRHEAEELCFAQQLKLAQERGHQAIKCATELYGKNSLRLVPFYLVLVDIALKERQLKQAEEVLSLVNWLLVKDPKASNPTLSSGASTRALPLQQQQQQQVPEELKNLYVVRMNKLYSTLLMEYEVFPEALQRAAHGAYHCSLLFGPEHLYTSELYFCLGQIFSRMQQQPQQQQQQQHGESALGMFDKVVDIWYRFLTNPPEETAAWILEHQRLRVQEATAMLQHVVSARTSSLGAHHVATGEVMYTLGLLFLYLGDHTQAKTLVHQALDLYVGNLGPDHLSTLDVKNVLQQLQDAGV